MESECFAVISGSFYVLECSLKLCMVTDCGNKHASKGYCNIHYTRMKNHGVLEISNPHERNGSTANPEYEVWKKMRHRCNNPNDKRYDIYGAKGVTVCKRWQHSFNNFIEDMGRRPSNKYSIERLDSNGNYEPSNCVWATSKQQANNTSRNHLVEFNGKTQTVRQWCDELGLSYSRVLDRLNKLKWPINKALEMEK